MSWNVCLVRSRSRSIVPILYGFHNRSFRRSFTDGAAGSISLSNRSLDEAQAQQLLHPKLDEMINKLDIALSNSDLAGIHKTIPRLMHAADEAKQRNERFDAPLTSAHLRSVVKVLASSGRPYDISLVERIVRKPRGLFATRPDMDLHALISQALCEKGTERGRELAFQYLVALPDRFYGRSASPDMWHRFIIACAESSDKLRLEKAQQFLQERQIAMPTSTHQIEPCKSIENTSHGSSASSTSFSIQREMSQKNMDAALGIYRKARGQAYELDIFLAHDLIAGLCASSSLESGLSGLEQALEVYDDIQRVPVPQEPSARELFLATKRNIYGILLEGISSSQNLHLSGFVAKTLLKNMSSDRITFDSSNGLTAMTVISMRNAASFQEAFQSYQSHCLQKEGPRLDRRGYIVVLRSFSMLNPGGEPQRPPVNEYFNIVRDMRVVGHAISKEIYIQILRRLVPTGDNSSMFEVVRMVRGVHQRLKLDASFNPDTNLLNILMETYFSLDAWTEAFDVWKEMCVSGMYDNETISVIHNACANRNAWTVIAQICHQLHRSGFIFDKKSWDMWIDALIRSGDLNEAVRLVCMEMGKRRGEPQPDKDTFHLLIDLATRDDQRTEVWNKIEKYRPKLFEGLKSSRNGFSLL